METDHLPRQSGVYQLLNTVNSKFYVGSAINIRRRVKQHRYLLNLGSHSSPYLRNAWKKYGEHNFLANVLELCPADLLLEREQAIIDDSGCCDRSKGYNSCEIAGSAEHRHLSEQHKRKIGLAHKGRKFSMERRQRMSVWLKGRKMPPGFGAKVVSRNSGLKQSEESIEKRAKPYSFIDGEGKIHRGTNLKRFAQKMGLHRPNLRSVLDGTRGSCKGFRKFDS